MTVQALNHSSVIARAPSRENGFELAATLIEATCALATVPTRSWCDSVAVAVSRLFDHSVAGVLVCTLAPGGALRRTHGVGLALRCRIEPPAHPGVRPDSDRNNVQLIEQMRCGVSAVTHVGWSVPDPLPVRGEARTLPGLPPSDAANSGVWHPGGPHAMFMPARTSAMVVGIVSVGPPSLGRALVAYVGSRDPIAPASDLPARVLAVCLPLLARKAALALERTWSDKGSWLSDRERVVLERLIVGRSVPEIAAELGRSPHTVHDNVKSLHRKLAASTRGELIARALGRAEVIAPTFNDA